MLPKNLAFLSATISFFFSTSILCLAANPPSSQQIGAIDRTRQLQVQSQKLEQEVQQPRRLTQPAQNPPVQVSEAPNAQKILVKKLIVTGVTLFPADQINAIISQYENKNLSLNEIHQIAGRITDLYRKKGYVTSRAYVPPQKIKNGALEIKVIEAKVGNVQIKNNHYFSTQFIKKYVTLKKGDVFDYNVLKEDLQNVNEHPDLNIRALLTPGEEPGSTDVIFNEKDVLPIHISIGYDNFLSSYLGRNEYVYTFTDNNLSGSGDILTVQYNRAVKSALYYYYSGNYQYPVTQTLNLGFLYARSNTLLGKNLASVDSRGESKEYSLFGSKKLIKNDNLELDWNFGFDYKNVDNYLESELLSRDNLRISRTGFNLSIADDYGRTVLTDDFDYGIPGIMGGAKQNPDASDVPLSRTGADGRFALDTLNILRQQQLPLEMGLLWKNQLQFSSSILTQTEQFQAGGPANNRGFGPADAVGDDGYAMSWELYIPPYFIPRYYRIPYFNISTYDAVRFIAFYDWTNVHLNSVQPGDQKNQTLSSAGCGARLNVLDNLFANYEIAWPLMGRSSDRRGVQQWIDITISF